MRRAALLVLLLGLLGGACAKKADAPPPAPDNPALPAAELKRGEEACTTYVERVCACTTEQAKKECELAKALPEAIRVALEIRGGTEQRVEAVRANAEVRKVIKGCIESLAQLPSLGCQ